MVRHETDEERSDRKWLDLLQELRVMQTGVQLTAGFLLTLPFQSRFSDLDDTQRYFYLGLVALAGVTTALVLAPVALHRRLFGQHVKDRLVATAHRLAKLAVRCVALLVVAITAFIFDVVVGRTAALVAGGLMGALAILLIVVLPHRLVPGHGNDDDG